jgi:hypothetical protein
MCPQRLLTCLLVATLMSACAARPAQRFELPGSNSRLWHGYERYDFDLDGRPCIVVRPAQVAAGTPWVWRATFFGQTPQVDLALLAHGFHLAYMEVADLCGSPAAVRHWDAFYAFLVQEHGFSARPALTAISRGGLVAYNWAAANPDKLSCLFADMPVCDFRSWPGGLDKSRRDDSEWQRCLAEYGLSEAAASTYSGNPIDRLAPLASAGVPLLHAHSLKDDIVPFSENTAVVEQRYRDLGGEITVIIKPQAGHVAGVPDPQVVVDFILGNTLSR